MKRSTKKLLLWLYSPEIGSTRSMPVSNLSLILPDLKKSGFRSLLNLLRSQQYLNVETEVSLTAHGRSALEAEFPALKYLTQPIIKNWQMVTFIEAPSNDRQFRYLRQYLLNHRFGQLSRGTYLFPFKLQSEVMSVFTKLYVGKVVVTGISNWSFGDERLVAGSVFGLKDLMSGYSGISKEIHLLLKKINSQKSIEDKDKTTISLVFDRLADLLVDDLGLLQFYYPDSKSGLDLLFQLQDLI